MAGESWAVAGRDGADRWQEVLSATHLAWTVRVDAPRFAARVRRRWIDDLALVDCACGPCSGTRQRRHIATTDGEFVVVLVNRGGRETVDQGGAAALRPGDAVVWDSTRPARFAVHEPLTKRSLLVPRAALAEVHGAAPAGGVLLDGHAPATRLLLGYLDALAGTLPALGPAAVAAARNATLELLAGAMRTDADVPASGSVRHALRAAMDRYIERHLLGGAVTAGELAAAHGVSVRTVNRVFHASGHTLGEVVRVRRLARAREELSESDRPVSAIALRWGFADPSHFTRSFRAHYGTSPTAYRRAARTGARVPAGGAQVQAGGAPAGETPVTAARRAGRGSEERTWRDATSSSTPRASSCAAGSTPATGAAAPPS